MKRHTPETRVARGICAAKHASFCLLLWLPESSRRLPKTSMLLLPKSSTTRVTTEDAPALLALLLLLLLLLLVVLAPLRCRAEHGGCRQRLRKPSKTRGRSPNAARHLPVRRQWQEIERCSVRDLEVGSVATRRRYSALHPRSAMWLGQAVGSRLYPVIEEMN